MTTKNQVVSFVSMVKAKALKSINEKYDPLIEIEQLRVVKEECPGLAEHFALAQEAINQLVLNAVWISDNLEQYPNLVLNPSYGRGIKHLLQEISSYDKETEGLKGKDVLMDTLASYLPDVGQLASMRSDRAKEIKEITAAYDSVQSAVSNMANASRGIKYLDSLGFDITYFDRLDHQVLPKVDTEKLFVCGERS